MIVCAGNSESFSFATSVGVGLVESASRLTQICLFDKPDFILFVGSAGSYGKYNIFDVVESSHATQVELSLLEGNSYTPIDNAIDSQNTVVQNAAIVNSSNYISTNADLGLKMRSFEIELENMEFFSILSIAKRFEIPAGGVFVVTNHTNKNAHQDFLANHEKAKNILISYLVAKKIIQKA